MSTLSTIRRRTHWRWLDWCLVGAALAVMCLLVWHGMTTDSAYFDEGYSSYLAHLSIGQAAYYTSFDVHPPLYYVLLHGWIHLFGDSIVVMRLMSLVCAGVAAVLAFLLVRRCFGRGAAIVAIWCLVLSPLFLRYSTAARMYTLALALVIGATYILVLLHTEHRTVQRQIHWATYGLIVALGMWTNYFTALVWLTHGLWLVYETVRHQQKRVQLLGWLAAIGLAVVLYAPWLPSLIKSYTFIHDHGFWIAPVSADTVSSTITTSTVFLASKYVQGWLIVAVVAWMAVVVWLIRCAYHKAREPEKHWLRLLSWCGVGPVVLLFIGSLPPLQPSYAYRYVLAGVSFLILLIGVCLTNIQLQKRAIFVRFIVISVVIGVLLIGTVQATLQGNRNLDTGVKGTVGDVMREIEQTDHKNTPVLTYSAYAYYAASVYRLPTHQIYYRFDDSLANVGATRGLYDIPTYGVKDIAAFGTAHAYVWIISEDKQGVKSPPVNSWQRVRDITVLDPGTHATGTFAVLYRTS